MGTRQNFTVLHVANYHSLRGGWDDPNCAQYSTHPALSAPRRALSQARAFQFPIPPFRGVAMAALNCAHRTSTVSPCAFCEQGGYLAAPSPYFRDRALREHRRSSASTPSFQHPVRLNTERSASPQSLCQNSTAFEFLKKTTRGFKGPYHFTQRVLAELQDGAQRP